MANNCKYYKQQRYVSYDSGNTWQPLNEYQKGALYEEHSADCGYEVIYKWEVISGYTCSGCTKYEKTQKYVSTDGGSTWEVVTPAEYGIGNVIEYGSEDCGCSTQYRWWARPQSGEYLCSGTSKYTKEYYQVSYDGGSTWENVVPEQTRCGDLIESASTDCGYTEPIYRTITTGTTCVGYDKYTLTEYQVSYNDGFSWATTASSATTLIEADSEDCGYVPPTPPTPIDYSSQYLTFVAREDGTFGCTRGDNGSGTIKVEYSLDSGSTWSELNSDYSSTPTVTTGSKIMWKSRKTPDSNYGVGRFTSTAKFDVEGNPLSMIYGDNFTNKTDLENVPYHFYKMLMGNINIVNAQNLSLPLTSVGYQGCLGMFSGCTSLETAPVLSATTLSNECYYCMFKGCTSLTVAPELPATVLGEEGIGGQGVYYSMFEGCTSLTTAPSTLPATALRLNCYNGMFKGCASLTTAPIICATTLESDCCRYMFSDCTSLTTAPNLSATTLEYGCYSNMFTSCTSLTTAPILSARTLASYCYSNMFASCTSLNSVTCLATNISATRCTYNWLNHVSSTGTFTKASSMKSWTIGSSDGIPSGWTVVNA